jgi:hypothetical protein
VNASPRSVNSGRAPIHRVLLFAADHGSEDNALRAALLLATQWRRTHKRAATRKAQRRLSDFQRSIKIQVRDHYLLRIMIDT